MQNSILQKNCKKNTPSIFELRGPYMDDLILEIESTRCDIKLNEIKIDIIMYADDVILIANRSGDLEEMLSTTEEYGKQNEIKFNPNKTTYMEKKQMMFNLNLMEQY
jgi:hypothetical protein